ncbi:MAG TPA: hypothetical protein VMW74_06360 [Nitrosopumilaceae archaeon]|nr:hypothetical protein [Nitrosopumilaceae archaeon]
MNKKQVQRSSRLALFSENERRYLRGKRPLSYVMKSQLHHNLDQRFDALMEDLNLLNKSPQLKPWRSLRSWKYRTEFTEVNYFSNLFSDVEYGYQSAIRRITKGKGKHKKSLYWLDRSPTKIQKIDERIFNSSYLFRHIKIKLTEHDKKLFLDAYHNQSIFPDNKKDAITIDEIKKRLTGVSKIRTNEEKVKISKDTFQDPRDYAIFKVRERYIKKINKILKKFDSQITQFRVDFHN